MQRRWFGWALALMTVSGAALAVSRPHAWAALAILAAQDDPARLSDVQINSALRNGQIVVADQIETALKANDAGLAESFVDLAREKNIAVPPELSQRVIEAVNEENSASHFAERFASGLVTGNADDAGSLTGTIAGDLFVFGDIRDVVREGKHLVMGEDTDHLVLGLAAAGLAVTAATYVSIGGAAPVRAGLTLVKDARKVGRLGEGLTEWAGRSAREVVDTPMLQNAVASGCGDAASANRERDPRRLQHRQSRRAGAACQGRRTGGRKGRLARRTRYVEDRGGTRGCRARRATGRIKGRPDSRHPEAIGPRRPAAGGRSTGPVAVDIRRPFCAVRSAVVDQGNHRAADPVVARSQEGATVAGANRGCRDGRWRHKRLVSRIRSSYYLAAPLFTNFGSGH